MKRILLILVLLITLISVVHAEDDRWLLITTIDIYSVWLDTETLKYTDNQQVIDAWIKLVFTDAGRQLWINALKKSKASPELIKGYKKLNYSLHHDQFMVNPPKWRLLKFVDYGDSDVPLGTATYDNFKWSDLTPGSANELVYKKAAAYLWIVGENMKSKEASEP